MSIKEEPNRIIDGCVVIGKIQIGAAIGLAAGIVIGALAAPENIIPVSTATALIGAFIGLANGLREATGFKLKNNKSKK